MLSVPTNYDFLKLFRIYDCFPMYRFGFRDIFLVGAVFGNLYMLKSRLKDRFHVKAYRYMNLLHLFDS